MNEQQKEQYLKEVVDELNASCHYRDEYNAKFGCDNWEVEYMDLEWENCKRYCIIYYQYSSDESRRLCESCANILESKIRAPFNRTPLEINIELNKIRELLESLLKKLNLNTLIS